MTFDPNMDALVAYDSSDEDAPAEDREQAEASAIDPAQSKTILSKLKEKFPMNSAPYVPNRVSMWWALIRVPTYTVVCRT